MSKDSKLTINTKRLEEHVFVMFSNINICLSLIFTDYHQHPNDRFEHFKKVSLFNYIPRWKDFILILCNIQAYV